MHEPEAPRYTLDLSQRALRGSLVPQIGQLAGLRESTHLPHLDASLQTDPFSENITNFFNRMQLTKIYADTKATEFCKAWAL